MTTDNNCNAEEPRKRIIEPTPTNGAGEAAPAPQCLRANAVATSQCLRANAVGLWPPHSVQGPMQETDRGVVVKEYSEFDIQIRGSSSESDYYMCSCA